MKNQTALITGASGAIGGAVAVELAGRGFDLALHYHTNEKKALDLAKEIKSLGRKAFLFRADISSVDKVKKLVKDASGNLGGLSLLVHMAAIFIKTPFGNVREKIFDNIIGVDLKAAFFLAQEAARVMQNGRMIFISDVAAQKPYINYLPYCMAKAGIDSLVKGLAKKLAPKISVNAIAPYIVTRPKDLSDSGWNELKSRTSVCRESSPQEIAEIAAFLASTSPSLTGQIITVDGGRILR